MELPPATVRLPGGADPHSPEFLAAVSTASLGLLDALGADALCGAEAAEGRAGGKRLPQYRVAPDGKLYTRLGCSSSDVEFSIGAGMIRGRKQAQVGPPRLRAA
ncbi:unnamed protein product [Prorocentrum cordatum]|uniref:Uncharacterized protein n=1 Tax=Prorocentrum cordatum TaxID=2364126 RepID=A0ABN9PZK9_9DINO|nr:unnamed protein product [Polarella glacialis]